MTRGRYLALTDYVGQHYAVLVGILLLVAFVPGLYLATTLVDQVRLQLWQKLFSPWLDRVESAVINRLKS